MSPEANYSFESFMGDLINNNSKPNDAIYDYLWSIDTSKLSKWLNRLEKIKSITIKGAGAKAAAKRGKKSKLIGQVFEKIVRILLDGCKVFRHDGNIRTTTSEIDFLISVEPLGMSVPFLRDVGSHIIGEAKCIVDTPLKTEWINELAGLLPTHSAKYAVLFTANKREKVRNEHRTAIGLQAARGLTITPFGLTQFEDIENGGNFLKILAMQDTLAKTMSTDLKI